MKMKKQKFNKKLELKKNTIANLGLQDMDDVKGGIDFPTVTCHIPSFCKWCTDVYSECLVC